VRRRRISTPRWALTSSYPLLSPDLKAALALIVPIDGGGVVYWPCAALGRDEEWREAVYFAEATAWFRFWGVWPNADSGKQEIAAGDVVDVRESRLRLPARFAAELYAAGESGMGYTVFEVGFVDGSRAAQVTGNAVDFVTYPPGKGPEDVVGVYPHAGRAAAHTAAVNYLWCLFTGPSP
jgi:hypothetical protein